MNILPFAMYDIEELAPFVGVSAGFLTDLVARAEKDGVIPRQSAGQLMGCDIGKLGKRYYGKIETEQHVMASERIRQQDLAEARKRGVL